VDEPVCFERIGQQGVALRIYHYRADQAPDTYESFETSASDIWLYAGSHPDGTNSALLVRQPERFSLGSPQRFTLFNPALITGGLAAALREVFVPAWNYESISLPMLGERVYLMRITSSSVTVRASTFLTNFRGLLGARGFRAII
jgi:hypothetical protein